MDYLTPYVIVSVRAFSRQSQRSSLEQRYVLFSLYMGRSSDDRLHVHLSTSASCRSLCPRRTERLTAKATRFTSPSVYATLLVEAFGREPAPEKLTS